MKYIKDLKDGDRVFDIYLCKHKQSAVTKNGKAYDNVILQDKTGTVDAKVWDPNNPGIGDFDSLDYIEVYGDVTTFQNALQVNVKRIRKCQEGEYAPADYLPVSEKDIEEMYGQLLGYIKRIGNPYLKALMEAFFVKDEEFIKAFKQSSAAKTVHHGFVGGLLEHTLSVTNLCDYYCKAYPILKRDLLISAAICHDIGKVKELSLFPQNDYTDDGQLLGHIVMGTEMVGEKIRVSWPIMGNTNLARLKSRRLWKLWRLILQIIRMRRCRLLRNCWTMPKKRDGLGLTGCLNPICGRRGWSRSGDIAFAAGMSGKEYGYRNGI